MSYASTVLYSFVAWARKMFTSSPHSPLSTHRKNLLYRISVTLETANRLPTSKSNPPGKAMRNLDTAVLWQPQKCTIVFATETIVSGTLRLRSGGPASAWKAFRNQRPYTCITTTPPKGAGRQEAHVWFLFGSTFPQQFSLYSKTSHNPFLSNPNQFKLHHPPYSTFDVC